MGDGETMGDRLQGFERLSYLKSKITILAIEAGRTHRFFFLLVAEISID